MIDAPERIWVSNLPYDLGQIEDLKALGLAWNISHGQNPVEYTPADLAKQAEADAYARGVADAREVKPLEWVDIYEYGTISQAANPFGFYTITDDEYSAAGRIFVEFHATETGDCSTHAVELNGDFFEIEDAKAAAQADYERRILSALTDPIQTPADLGQENDNG